MDVVRDSGRADRALRGPVAMCTGVGHDRRHVPCTRQPVVVARTATLTTDVLGCPLAAAPVTTAPLGSLDGSASILEETTDVRPHEITADRTRAQHGS